MIQLDFRPPATATPRHETNSTNHEKSSWKASVGIVDYLFSSNFNGVSESNAKTLNMVVRRLSDWTIWLNIRLNASSIQNDPSHANLAKWKYQKIKLKIIIVSVIWENKVKTIFVLLVMTWILVLDLQTRVESLEKDKQEQNSRHNRDISRLARMIEQSSSHRSILQINNRLVEEQILRWSESLSSARVTRWGGVISTPGKIRVSFNLL